MRMIYQVVKITTSDIYGEQAKQEILLEMDDVKYNQLRVDLLEAPTSERRVEVMAEFLPADIADIVKPEDT